MARLGSSRTNPLHFRLNESMTLCETLVADWQQALTEEKTTIGLEAMLIPDIPVIFPPVKSETLDGT